MGFVRFSSFDFVTKYISPGGPHGPSIFSVLCLKVLFLHVLLYFIACTTPLKLFELAPSFLNHHLYADDDSSSLLLSFSTLNSLFFSQKSISGNCYFKSVQQTFISHLILSKLCFRHWSSSTVLSNIIHHYHQPNNIALLSVDSDSQYWES